MKSITGEKFNRLTAIKFSHIKNKKSYWVFECECGNIKKIKMDCVIYKSSKTKSCGCLNKEKLHSIKRNYKHGMRGSSFYTIYTGMKGRCCNKRRKDYVNYGGRGIKICDRWHNFENFKVDMYNTYLEHIKKYGRHNTSLERLNNEADYSKKNCKWATRIEQNNNTRNNRYVLYNNKYVTMAELSRILNCDYEVLRRKIHKNSLSYEEVIEEKI